MTNYWAIAVGVNQYQFFQPLMYGQWDAQALHHFLTTQGSFPAEHCQLLTDISPSVKQHSTLAKSDTIQATIAHICHEKVQSADTIWFFFSGYGVQFDGKDYLMLADSDPSDLPQTGFAIEDLFTNLKDAPTDNILVLLDIKRSQGSMAEPHVGTHTAALAEEYGIPTILSCKADQFSYETLTLRQGLFTSALLEGLRHYGCVTLEHLVQHLGDRLPQLSEQHWRPKQEPLAIIPDSRRYQLILPGKVLSPNQPASLPPSPPDSIESPIEEPPLSRSQPISNPDDRPDDRANGKAGESDESHESDESDESDDASNSFWKNFTLWGGLIVLALLLGVLLRNQVFSYSQDAAGTAGATLESAPDEPSNETTEAATPAAGSLTTAESPNADEPPFELALDALRDERYEDVLTWLDQVPSSEHDENYADLRADAEELYAQSSQQNQQTLNQAIASLGQSRQLTPTNQASDFSRAITQARNIKPGQPLYEQAQQHIQRWSGVILDLAKARANAGNYAGAIAAARLIPPEQTEIYEAAQQSIQDWQPVVDQQTVNQQVIQDARAMLQPGQASSYSRAISKLRTIQENQPSYAEAQRLIEAWSQDILTLARDRAAWGSLYNAIDTAALVPQGTSAYAPARDDIEQWRSQLIGG
ncbi:MAG TPA: caspase family protein [Elainellaceae cyanobacterium]